jgi:hypothetical protein
MRISEFKNVLNANAGKTINITLSGVGCNKVRTANVDSLKLNESGRIQFDVPRAGHTFTVISNVKSIVRAESEVEPERPKSIVPLGG